MSHWIEQSNSMKDVNLSDFLSVTKKIVKGRSVQNNGVMHRAEPACIAIADGVEMAIDGEDAMNEVNKINLEVADGPSSWEAMIEPIIRSPKMVRGNREFADEVPSPRTAEMFAKANKERAAAIAAMAEAHRSFWKDHRQNKRRSSRIAA
jgi:hypothetical protein